MAVASGLSSSVAYTWGVVSNQQAEPLHCGGRSGRTNLAHGGQDGEAEMLSGPAGTDTSDNLGTPFDRILGICSGLP